jgi:hypothetical protein
MRALSRGQHLPGHRTVVFRIAGRGVDWFHGGCLVDAWFVVGNSEGSTICAICAVDARGAWCGRVVICGATSLSAGRVLCSAEEDALRRLLAEGYISD